MHNNALDEDPLGKDECKNNGEEAYEALSNITNAEKKQVDKNESIKRANSLKNQDSDKSGKLNFLQSCNNAANDIYDNNTFLRENNGNSCKIFSTPCNAFNSVKSSDKKILNADESLKSSSTYNWNLKEWKLPEYIDNIKKENMHISKRPLSQQSQMRKRNSQSQTELKDFNFLNHISEVRNNIDSSNYRIINNIFYSKDVNLKSSAYNFESSCNSNVLSFDTSTNTDDLLNHTEISEKIVYLTECFPKISEDHLLSYLEDCNNDVQWLCDLLIEDGFQYNAEKLNIYISSDSCSTSSLTKRTTYLHEVPKLAIGNEPQKNRQVMLNTDFANELANHFGTVSKSTSVDTHADMDLKLSQQIHQESENTVFNSNQTLKKSIKSRTLKKTLILGTSHVPPLIHSEEPSSLKEIMDREFALELHKEEKLKEDDVIASSRTKLYHLFPGVDSILLDYIFDSNHHSLDDSLLVLQNMEQPKTVKNTKDIKEWKKQKYSNIHGRDHGMILKQENKKASELITLERNPSSASNRLDLHGLHVREAINLLKKFLQVKKQYMIKIKQTTPLIVYVITGQGHHSRQGPKIQPAVKNYLAVSGYKYAEIKRGMLDVTVLP